MPVVTLAPWLASAPGWTRSPGSSRWPRSSPTTRSRCSSTCASTPAPGTWASTPSTSSSSPTCTRRWCRSGAPGSTCSVITSSPSWACSPRSSASSRPRSTLLVAQALLTAASVIPVCRPPRSCSAPGQPGIGLAYGFSWGLQQMANFDFHEIAFAVPLLAFSLSALVRRRPRRGRAVGAAAGVRQGGPGVHGGRDRPGHDRLGPGLGRRQADGPPTRGLAARRYGPASGRRPAAARPGCRGPGVGPGRCCWRLGPGLVGAGDRGDHPALQPDAPLPVLERRGSGRPRRRTLGGRRWRTSSPRPAREAVDHVPDPAARGVPRAAVPARADRACPAWRCGSSPPTATSGAPAGTTTPP